MEVRLFDEVGDLVVAMVPDGLGELRWRAHRGGIKVWFGPAKPPREHYEAQFIPRHFVDDGDGLAIEVGFHAEHLDETANQAAVDDLKRQKKAWAKELGKQAELGPFLGRDSWRRLSEVWLDPDPEDPDLAFEIAGRLVDYLELIEPVRQGG